MIRIFSKIKRKITGNYLKQHVFFNDEHIHLAFYPTGGLGDFIISKAVLEEILEDSKCKVTIFSDKKAFAKAVYGDITAEIKKYENYDSEFYKYDLALTVEHFVHVDCFKGNKIQTISPELTKKVRFIIDNWEELYVDINQQCWRERIQFDRCRIKGLDRWTELRMGNAFKISSKTVKIPMSEEAKCRWDDELKGVRYVTINYGADAMIPGKKQLKLWNKDNYEKLINLIHQSSRDIKIIQLGAKDAERISGVDLYVFGDSIEFTKYVLKGSLCHIDCEGGLVHLATQLGTKCIVLFGPTPEYMYAYEQNTNIVNEVCHGCMGLHDNWAYECFMGYETPKCMKDISAEKVFEELKKVIS